MSHHTWLHGIGDHFENWGEAIGNAFSNVPDALSHIPDHVENWGDAIGDAHGAIPNHISGIGERLDGWGEAIAVAWDNYPVALVVGSIALGALGVGVAKLTAGGTLVEQALASSQGATVFNNTPISLEAVELGEIIHNAGGTINDVNLAYNSAMLEFAQENGLSLGHISWAPAQTGWLESNTDNIVQLQENINNFFDWSQPVVSNTITQDPSFIDDLFGDIDLTEITQFAGNHILNTNAQNDGQMSGTYQLNLVTGILTNPQGQIISNFGGEIPSWVLSLLPVVAGQNSVEVPSWVVPLVTGIFAEQDPQEQQQPSNSNLAGFASILPFAILLLILKK